jgi:cytochrome c biogenesis protein CcdA
MFPYIFRKGVDRIKGTRLAIYFSLGRITAYVILGTVAVALLNTLGLQREMFKQIAGVFIIITVAVDILKPRAGLCHVIKDKLFGRYDLNMYIFGLLIGLSPCAPLLGLLTFIAAKSEHVWHGAMYGLAFGLGSLFSPLLFIGFFAGWFSSVMSRTGHAFLILKIAADLVLVYLGLRLLL